MSNENGPENRCERCFFVGNSNQDRNEALKPCKRKAEGLKRPG